MRHYHLLQNHYYRPTINIDKVSARSEGFCDAAPCADCFLQLISLPEAQVEAPEGAVPVIDLVHLGKFKLVSEAPSPYPSPDFPVEAGAGELEHPLTPHSWARAESTSLSS
jgi:hypothetical protein